MKKVDNEKKEVFMNKDIVPDGFTLGLALFDALPVLFFGISAILLGYLFGSVLFVIGAVLCFAAGAAKVLWKIIVVLRKKNVWFLFIQMRILMPIGFLMMILAFFLAKDSMDLPWIMQAATESPVSVCFLLGILGMVLMGIFAFVLDSSDKKSNWIEQITNCIAQLMIMCGVILLAYGSSYYHAGPEAEAALQSSDGVQVAANEDTITFLPDDATGKGLIFYPGAKVEFTAYAPLMKEIAEEGITVVIARMPLGIAFFGMNRADAIMKEHPEIDSWYIGGHSLGGAVAAMYAKKHEVSGIVFLGSYSTKNLTEIPVLSVYGSNDMVLNKETYQKNHILLEGDLTEIEIPGGNHAQFADYGEQAGDGEATITGEEQQEITADAIETFILE